MSPTIHDTDGLSLRGFWWDFSIGLTVFVVATLWFSIGPGEAFPMPPPIELAALSDIASGFTPFIPTLKPTVPLFGSAASAPHLAAVAALGLAFASLFAANLALVRHLRHAYLLGRQ